MPLSVSTYFLPMGLVDVCNYSVVPVFTCLLLLFIYYYYQYLPGMQPLSEGREGQLCDSSWPLWWKLLKEEFRNQRTVPGLRVPFAFHLRVTKAARAEALLAAQPSPTGPPAYFIEQNFQTGREHLANMKRTLREHSGNIQATFRQHSGNIQGTFRQHSVKMFLDQLIARGAGLTHRAASFFHRAQLCDSKGT
jgi:hypothetical protein